MLEIGNAEELQAGIGFQAEEVEETQILIFWRSNKNTVIVQLAMRSGRIRVNYHILAVIIPVV